MQMQMIVAIQIIGYEKPMSQLGLPKESIHIHRFVSLSSIQIKGVQGMCSNAQKANRHDIHKNKISSGVNSRFERGLMYEIGRPQCIKIGKAMSVMTSCSSKKLRRYVCAAIFIFLVRLVIMCV